LLPGNQHSRDSHGGNRAVYGAEDVISPDPDRFDDTASEPGLVSEGPEAKRAKREFLTDTTVVI
jgi:hypothetical protein